MIFYLLYRIGYYLALHLPLGFSYGAAVLLADIHYFLYANERRSVIENLKIILDAPEGDELKPVSREVFRNFAKYLVDFFRFSRIDSAYIKKFVQLDGLSNIDDALRRQKGVIIISAHIGNWELGGFILGKLGYSIRAVVLTHRDKKINDFFKAQRALSNFKSIEFGPSLRGCYRALKNNELLALLGDRDFSKHGVEAKFFSRNSVMPKGPPVLSYRTGAAIVPSFVLRNSDDTFRFVFEKPILPPPDLDEVEAVKDIMKKYLSVVESYIKEYPGQWYVFKEFWSQHDKDMRPDTII